MFLKLYCIVLNNYKLLPNKIVLSFLTSNWNPEMSRLFPLRKLLCNTQKRFTNVARRLFCTQPCFLRSITWLFAQAGIYYEYGHRSEVHSSCRRDCSAVKSTPCSSWGGPSLFPRTHKPMNARWLATPCNSGWISVTLFRPPQTLTFMCTYLQTDTKNIDNLKSKTKL